MTLVREAIQIDDEAEWLRLKSRDVTASCAAWLFGEGYGSPQRLAEQVRVGASRPRDIRDVIVVRAGRILEPGVAVAVAHARPDWRLTKATTYHRLPELRLGATPDYWLDDDGVVECKTCGQSVFDKWGGRPPLAHLLQTLVQMICADRERGYVAEMIRKLPEFPLYVFEVRRHPEAEKRLLAAAARFWRAHDAGRALPTADASGLVELLTAGASIEPRRILPRVDISKLEAPF